jgi:hypothetical protein
VEYDHLLPELAEHLEAVARTLRRMHASQDQPPATLQTNEPVTPLDPDEVVRSARQIHPQLGSHQEMGLRKLAAAHPRGLTARGINDNWSTLPNTYTTLDKLATLGLVRRQFSRPRRYHLGPKLC